MKLISVPEAAELLGLTRDHVYSLIRCGVIPSVACGRAKRIDKERLEEWVRNGGQAFAGGWRKERSR